LTYHGAHHRGPDHHLPSAVEPDEWSHLSFASLQRSAQPNSDPTDPSLYIRPPQCRSHPPRVHVSLHRTLVVAFRGNHGKPCRVAAVWPEARSSGLPGRPRNPGGCLLNGSPGINRLLRSARRPLQLLPGRLDVSTLDVGEPHAAAGFTGCWVAARMKSSSGSLGTRTLLPNVTTGSSLPCISRYAFAREIPSNSATSAARRSIGSLSTRSLVMLYLLPALLETPD